MWLRYGTTKIAAATMKVAQISKAGGDFEIVERENPKPGVRPDRHGRIRPPSWAALKRKVSLLQ
jgi:hypothetical protein